MAKYIKKRAKGLCAVIAVPDYQVIASLRPKEYKQIAKSKRTVARAYGGSRCANCAKLRIVRVFD